MCSALASAIAMHRGSGMQGSRVMEPFKRSKTRLLVSILLPSLVAICLAPSGNGYANSADEKDTRDDGQNKYIEEISITARKREESQQRVPLTVGVLSAEAIDKQGLNNIELVGKLMPNVGVEPTPGTGTSASVSLRGISVYDFELYIDPPIALYVDGVNYARPQMFNFDNLIDIERIEVLYGPQGTLFGRNTTGGAISVTTAPPLDERRVRATLGYGRYNQLTGRAIVDTGYLGNSTLKAKLAYSYERADGWQRNLNTSDRHSGGASDSNFVSVRLSSNPTERLVADYRFDFSDTEYNVGGNQTIDATSDVIAYFGSSPSNGGQPFLVNSDFMDEVYQNHPHPRSKSRTYGNALTTDYEVSDLLNLKSILAYRVLSVDEINNGGAQGYLRGQLLDPITFAPIGVGDVTPFSTPRLRDRADQFSAEVQASGLVDNISYTLGAFFFREHATGDNLNRFTFVLPGGAFGLNLSTQRAYELRTRSYAAYGQLSYVPPVLDDRFEITGGLRYTLDDKDLKESLFQNEFPSGSQRLSEDWDDVSYSISVSYQFTDVIMGFGRVATAYKAGGYNPGVLQSAYGPEEARVFELGVKTDLLDRRLRVNLSAFRTVYDKIQVPLLEITATQNSTVLSNAAAATYTGFEMSSTFIPISGWRIDANVGYVDPEYTDFDYRDPVTLQLLDVSDEARSPLTSKLTYNIGIAYESSRLDWGLFSVRADYSFRSHRYYFPLDRMSPRNRVVRGDPQRSLRARLVFSEIALFGGNQRFRFDIWGENLLNQEQRVSGIDFGALGFGTVNYVTPRTFGISVSAEF